MRGRWFFWIPVILFGIYMLYMNFPKTVIWAIGILYALLTLAILFEGDEEIKRLKIYTFDDFKNLIKRRPIELLNLVFIPPLLYGITLFFDHYFTIKKHEG